MFGSRSASALSAVRTRHTPARVASARLSGPSARAAASSGQAAAATAAVHWASRAAAGATKPHGTPVTGAASSSSVALSSASGESLKSAPPGHRALADKLSPTFIPK